MVPVGFLQLPSPIELRRALQAARAHGAAAYPKPLNTLYRPSSA